MKNSFLIASVFILFLTSCRKEKTCTCRDPNGLGTTSTLKSNKREMDQFEQDCLKTKVAYFDGTSTVYIPCTIN